jgi:hypothetical protein
VQSNKLNDMVSGAMMLGSTACAVGMSLHFSGYDRLHW